MLQHPEKIPAAGGYWDETSPPKRAVHGTGPTWTVNVQNNKDQREGSGTYSDDADPLVPVSERAESFHRNGMGVRVPY